jgi:hypothetical protein
VAQKTVLRKKVISRKMFVVLRLDARTAANDKKSGLGWSTRLAAAQSDKLSRRKKVDTEEEKRVCFGCSVARLGRQKNYHKLI